ncbi:PLP-dependent cysteine synthase family protein [Agromyces binzhouensis]|uniref:Cysteine synthase family protein n=1 Tax=Agromyces binzhouensis TaxID=1817495 RepID=A0A4Q2JYN1_9MICO|nr:cysteine synthase family protein [Agromyces binzhouensis]RXZ51378.1 cysteine synthase family protein [Agromyces binzhouensis]
MDAHDDNGVLGAIGGTPIVRLESLVPDGAAEVWVKIEGANPTGSYKDRMAVSVLTAAVARGDVSPGDTVVEYTGGSTGTSLAFVAAVLGLRFTAVFSDAFSASKQQAMEAFGGEVLVEASHGDGITPELVGRMRERAYALAEQPGHYYADQFGSPDVIAGYASMGEEIGAALGDGIDVFCTGVGTGGALMGTLRGLHGAGLEPQVVALEPAEAPLLTEGVSHGHAVEGVAVFPDPPFLDRGVLDGIRTIGQERAFETCRRLARTEGIFAGGSTGMNVSAAIDLAVELGAGHRVVTIACDHGLKYLGGRIYS